MRRRILFVVVGAPLALIAIGAGTALAVPRARHVISGLLNMPDRMPALSSNSQVHYQPGAEDFARDVAALLPDAIARVEAVHGRPFAHPVIVGVYATPEVYMAANGLGSVAPVGVTFFDRVKSSSTMTAACQNGSTFRSKKNPRTARPGIRSCWPIAKPGCL
jgi:hypothetical protein